MPLELADLQEARSGQHIGGQADRDHPRLGTDQRECVRQRGRQASGPVIFAIVSDGGMTTVSAVASIEASWATATEKSAAVATGPPSGVQVITS